MIYSVIEYDSIWFGIICEYIWHGVYVYVYVWHGGCVEHIFHWHDDEPWDLGSIFRETQRMDPKCSRHRRLAGWTLQFSEFSMTSTHVVLTQPISSSRNLSEHVRKQWESEIMLRRLKGYSAVQLARSPHALGPRDLESSQADKKMRDELAVRRRFDLQRFDFVSKTRLRLSPDSLFEICTVSPMKSFMLHRRYRYMEQSSRPASQKPASQPKARAQPVCPHVWQYFIAYSRWTLNHLGSIMVYWRRHISWKGLVRLGWFVTEHGGSQFLILRLQVCTSYGARLNTESWENTLLIATHRYSLRVQEGGVSQAALPFATNYLHTFC